MQTVMNHAYGQLHAARLADELRLLRAEHQALQQALVGQIARGADSPSASGPLGLARLLAERAASGDLVLCALGCDELAGVLVAKVVFCGASRRQDEDDDTEAAAAERVWCGEQVGFSKGAGSGASQGRRQASDGASGAGLVSQLVHKSGLCTSIADIVAVVGRHLDEVVVERQRTRSELDGTGANTAAVAVTTAGMAVGVASSLAAVVVAEDESESIVALRAVLGLCMVLMHGPDNDPTTLSTAKALLSGHKEEEEERAKEGEDGGEREEGGEGDMTASGDREVNNEMQGGQHDATGDGWGGFVAFEEEDPFGGTDPFTDAAKVVAKMEGTDGAFRDSMRSASTGSDPAEGEVAMGEGGGEGGRGESRKGSVESGTAVEAATTESEEEKTGVDGLAGGLAAAAAALLASNEDLEGSDDEEEGASAGTVGVWRVAWIAVELLGAHDIEVARRGLSVLNNLAAAIVGTNAHCTPFTRYARCTYCMLHILHILP